MTKEQLLKTGKELQLELTEIKNEIPESVMGVYAQIEFSLKMVLTSLDISEEINKKSIKKIQETYKDIDLFLMEIDKLSD